jgi:pilus assembly protein CpaE
VLKDVLLIGMNREDLTRLEDQLRDVAEVQLRTLLFDDTTNGTLRRALAETDLVVLSARGGQTHLLAALEAQALPTSQKLPILVCGDLNTVEATKLMVRIGVDDLLPSTPTTDELQTAVTKALRSHSENSLASRDPIMITVLGAAGGVGTSFIACNLAHILQSEARKPTLLIDLDQIYSPITSMLGLNPSRGIDDAISNLHTLDAITLDGYSTQHSSGLQLLSTINDGAFPRSINGSEFSRLLSIVKGRHDLIIVAANRWFDEASIESLVQSQFVLTVLRPELSDVRCARKLQSLLIQTIGLHDETIRTVVNRHSSRSALPDSFIKKGLTTSEIHRIAEDISLVRRSIDSGTPVLEVDREAATTRTLIELANSLAGTHIATDTKLLGRFWTSLSRSDKHP